MSQSVCNALVGGVGVQAQKILKRDLQYCNSGNAAVAEYITATRVFMNIMNTP